MTEGVACGGWLWFFGVGVGFPVETLIVMYFCVACEFVVALWEVVVGFVDCCFELFGNFDC